MSARGSGFAKLHTVTQAREIALAKMCLKTEFEKISTANSLNRVLSEDIVAPFDLPGFVRSAMDGYALKAEDTYGTTSTNPLRFPVIGQVEIGDTDPITLQNGTVIRISTGAPLPPGADAVIKIEDTEQFGEQIEIYSSISEGKNVASPDEDVKKGQLVLKKDTRITAWDIAMLESLGIDRIRVYCLPKIATLSTGNELIPSGSTPKIGEVIDSNRPAINAWVNNLGGIVVESKQVVDELVVIRNTLEELTSSCDLIISTGGTSVGSRDFVSGIIADMGELLVHGVTIRPGKPVALGIISTQDKQTPIVALPGYPLAAFINFYLFAAPLICQVTKYPLPWSKRVKIELGQKVASKVGSRDFVRLRQTKDGVKTIRITGAGILSSIVKADYLLEIPEDMEGFEAGEMVEVIKLRDDYD